MTNTPTYRQAVTAVGRLLQPQAGEPRVHRVIARRPDGTFRTVIDRTLTPAERTDG